MHIYRSYRSNHTIIVKQSKCILEEFKGAFVQVNVQLTICFTTTGRGNSLGLFANFMVIRLNILNAFLLGFAALAENKIHSSDLVPHTFHNILLMFI